MQKRQTYSITAFDPSNQLVKMVKQIAQKVKVAKSMPQRASDLQIPQDDVPTKNNQITNVTKEVVEVVRLPYQTPPISKKPQNQIVFATHKQDWTCKMLETKSDNRQS